MLNFSQIQKRIFFYFRNKNNVGRQHYKNAKTKKEQSCKSKKSLLRNTFRLNLRCHVLNLRQTFNMKSRKRPFFHAYFQVLLVETAAPLFHLNPSGSLLRSMECFQPQQFILHSSKKGRGSVLQPSPVLQSAMDVADTSSDEAGWSRTGFLSKWVFSICLKVCLSS